MRTRCACGCCGTCAQQPHDPTISEGTMNRFEAQGLRGDYEFEAFDGAEYEGANFGETGSARPNLARANFWAASSRESGRARCAIIAVGLRRRRRCGRATIAVRRRATGRPHGPRDRVLMRRDGERERATGPVRYRVCGPAPGRVPGPLGHTVLRGNGTGGDSPACRRSGIGAVSIRAGIGSSDKVRATPARRRAGAAGAAGAAAIRITAVTATRSPTTTSRQSRPTKSRQCRRRWRSRPSSRRRSNHRQ